VNLCNWIQLTNRTANRGVLLSTLLHAILQPSHHLLNVLLQIANKLGLSNKKNRVVTLCDSCEVRTESRFHFVVLLSTLLHAILHPSHHLLNVLLQIANKLGLSNKKKIYIVVTLCDSCEVRTESRFHIVVLLSTLLHAILHPSHHLLNVLLQIANKLGLSNKIKIYQYSDNLLERTVGMLWRVGVAIDRLGLVIGPLGHSNTQVATTRYKLCPQLVTAHVPFPLSSTNFIRASVIATRLTQQQHVNAAASRHGPQRERRFQQLFYFLVMWPSLAASVV
jgi:hypothetical protein